jgi:hypothetical protein
MKATQQLFQRTPLVHELLGSNSHARFAGTETGASSLTVVANGIAFGTDECDGELNQPAS